MPSELEMQKREITACFTGHRQLDAKMLPVLAVRLDRVLEAAWQKGYRRFLCGGALGFDLLAAERVVNLQINHPDVRLLMVIPCGDQSKRWSTKDCRRYERILYMADEMQVLSPNYYNGCMQVRNRHMVDRSSLCLCYLNKPKGGTMSTVAYAMRENLPILNLAMEDSCAAFIEG